MATKYSPGGRFAPGRYNPPEKIDPIINDDFSGILFVLLILAIFLLVVIFFYLWNTGNIHVNVNDILFLIPEVEFFQ